MSSSSHDPSHLVPALGFEEARLAHLQEFARATPEQKLHWLADMLELVQAARAATKAKAGDARRNQTT